MRVCFCVRQPLQSLSGACIRFFLSPKQAHLNSPHHTHTHTHTLPKQINVANVDANGVYTQGDFKTVALAGYIRGKGGADAALVEVVKAADIEG